MPRLLLLRRQQSQLHLSLLLRKGLPEHLIECQENGVLREEKHEDDVCEEDQGEEEAQQQGAVEELEGWLVQLVHLVDVIH